MVRADSNREETILLVEDEALIAMDEARMLTNHGYKVITASSGANAVEKVDTDPEISLILMDIDLGTGMDGTEAAEVNWAQLSARRGHVEEGGDTGEEMTLEDCRQRVFSRKVVLSYPRENGRSNS